MLEVDDVLNRIDSRLRKYVNDVGFRPSDETILVYVFREMVSEKAGLGFTSRRQMESLKRRLKNIFSKDVEIIYTVWDEHVALEDAFHKMLNSSVEGEVLSLNMSFNDGKNVNSWIEVAELTDEVKEEIEVRYLKMLEDSGLSSGFIQWIDSLCDLPSYPWLLRFIKVHQPINLKGIGIDISKEFPTVTEKWLSSKLDHLRKKRLIIREKSTNYVLTSKGLDIVPAGTSHTSSDIERALALGRKEW